MSEPSIEQIAEILLSNLEVGRRRKVMMIVGTSFDVLPDFDSPETLAKFNAALDLLAEHPEVQSFGDIHNWRHSELVREFAPNRLSPDTAKQIVSAADSVKQNINALERVLNEIEDEEVRNYLLKRLERIEKSLLGI